MGKINKTRISINVAPVRQEGITGDSRMADISKIIGDLKSNFGGSNDEQMKAVQLLKGLATSDDPKANKFMKALDKATTKIAGEMTESLLEGEKVYYTQYGVGSSKYSVSFYDGVRTHDDGSDFYDFRTFRNKRDLAEFIQSLVQDGYRLRGIGESVIEVTEDTRLPATDIILEKGDRIKVLKEEK